MLKVIDDKTEENVQDSELYYATNSFTGQVSFFMDDWAVKDFLSAHAGKNGWNKSYARLLTKEKLFPMNDEGGSNEFGC